MMITSIRYGRLVFMAVATILMFLFLLAQFSMRASGGKGVIDRAKEQFHYWFQKAVFKHNWEDIHCRPKPVNETTVEQSWIPKLALQLNLHDGTSVFDCNTGCNEWLKLLRKNYRNLRIGGAHIDQYAVEYAKKLFNDTPSTFGTISSDGKLEFFGDDIGLFDHVINFGGLQTLRDRRVQCNLVREMLRILKPGGSVFLGHNMEESDCHAIEKNSKVSLPGCYWSEKCLSNRTDIAEIYYIKEKDLFGAHFQIDDCHTAVFIHKKVHFSRTKDEPKFNPKYTPHEKMYYCMSKDQDAIANHMQISDLVLVQHSLGQGYKLAKKLDEMRNTSEKS